MFRYDQDFRRVLTQNLAAFDRAPLDATGLKHAAVAMTVVEDDGTACFLLTRRTPKLNAHSGQWALPGGRVDRGETAVTAALRELEEEVGLRRGEEAVLGVLDDYATRSGYLITPVVVWAGSDAAFVPNPAEVARIHKIPLSALDRPDSPEFLTIPESDRPVIRLYFEDSKIHAPTAAVIHQFWEVAVHGRPTRVAHYDQPVFAWR